MTDRDIIAALVECQVLSDWEAEAFASMQEWLDGHKDRGLSPKQRDVAKAAAIAKGLWVEPSCNLFSSGKVPIGIPPKKTRGEEFAATVLATRPLCPPGRRV
ncbi:MAG TPA: hypothetical protein VK540_31680 [Polyangiaceae bacterium]|nr:hypothetical protein [Polyangiaceae bacterium]